MLSSDTSVRPFISLSNTESISIVPFGSAHKHVWPCDKIIGWCNAIFCQKKLFREWTLSLVSAVVVWPCMFHVNSIWWCRAKFVVWPCTNKCMETSYNISKHWSFFASINKLLYVHHSMHEVRQVYYRLCCPLIDLFVHSFLYSMPIRSPLFLSDVHTSMIDLTVTSSDNAVQCFVRKNKVFDSEH